MELTSQNLHTGSKVLIRDSRLLSKVDGIPKRYEACGLKNYLIKDENRKAYAGCKEVGMGKSITLTGCVGTGKTHLAVATLKNFPMIRLSKEESQKIKMHLELAIQDDLSEEVKKLYESALNDGLYNYRRAKCKFISAPELFLTLSEAFNIHKPKSAIIDELSSYDCLCIDDLGAEKLTETNRHNFYLILDRFYREIKSMVLTTNNTIDEINQYEPRIASRLADMGKIYSIIGNDYRLAEAS